IGTIVIFLGAYLLEKTRRFAFWRSVAQLMAMLPMAVPGLVLGLAYIFFFNAKWNPLGFIYATMAILVVNSITHFYTVSPLTVSAVIFLYSADTKLAAVTIINMDESGFTAAAAAMAMSIVATSAAVKITHVLLTRRFERTTQAWRRR